MRKSLVVLADADNTLWDTDSIFASAQLELLAQVEAFAGANCSVGDRLGFVRRYDQALAARHHLYLKYPPHMLVASLAAGLHSHDPDSTATHVIAGRRDYSSLTDSATERVVADYMAALARVPNLLPSVREGLELARASGVQTYVITEGRADKQRKVISKHDLGELIEGVWELTKDKAQFERLRKRFGDGIVVVIGDQPDRDITPAHEAGCMTVLVPSKFRPEWHQADAWEAADLVARNYAEGVSWALTQAQVLSTQA
jgi:putative hydrolase of the HAD superfamily